MIPGYDEGEFGEALKGYFTPAQPISKPEHLHGRDAKLKTIQRALASPGKACLHLWGSRDRKDFCSRKQHFGSKSDGIAHSDHRV